MTISTRLFGYAICVSLEKTITVPMDRLRSQFGPRNRDVSEHGRMRGYDNLNNNSHTNDSLQETFLSDV